MRAVLSHARVLAKQLPQTDCWFPSKVDPLGVQDTPSLEQQASFIKAVRHVLANTEGVGDRFTDQARAPHYGDTEPRSIRGQATQREAIELIEEGIDVMPLPCKQP